MVWDDAGVETSHDHRDGEAGPAGRSDGFFHGGGGDMVLRVLFVAGEEEGGGELGGEEGWLGWEHSGVVAGKEKRGQD